MKFFRDTSRHIKNGFKNLFRNGWITTATILTMILTLTMIGSLLMFMSNVNNIVQDIEQGVKIRVHIDIAAEKQGEKDLQDKIAKLAHVDEVTYRSKDEELKDVVDNYGSEFELFEGDKNPFYNVLIVDVDQSQHLDTVQKEIEKLPMVVSAKYGSIDTKNLLKIIEWARIGLALLSAILVVIAITLISNTIRMTINARQTEIEIMRLVGAKNVYIRSPFVYEGIFIGVISAIVSTGILYFLYEGLSLASIEIIGVKLLKLSPTFPLIIYVGMALLVVGVLLGNIGARKSVKQYLTI